MASDDKPSTAAGNEKEEEATTEKDVLLGLPDAQLHIVDRSRSHQLAAGDLSLVRVRSSAGGASLAAVALLLPPEQWPLTRDVAAVKLDATHYFFTLVVPGDPEPLNYGLTFSRPDPRLDGLLAAHTTFKVRSVVGGGEGEAPASREHGEGEGEAAAYWTAVAPNAEDYGAAVARAIAAGAGHLADGILCCGEATAERLRWGRHVNQKRIQPGDADAEVSPEMLRRIKRAKKVTENTEKMANGILSLAKKVFNLLPGEIALASLEGYGTEGKLPPQRTKGSQPNEGLGAAGHAVRARWAVFKIRQAWNPKRAFKPRALIKSTSNSMFSRSRPKSRL
ncbi:hypothetical protein EJB05_13515, partial [Eragrostis curvula]